MKKILFLALTLVAIGLTSCSNEEKEVKKFVDDYAPQYASSGFELEKDGDAYVATFDGDRRIIIVKNKDGEWECEKAYGLQQFDPDLLGFAQRTGWVERKMDDATIAKRLDNKEFLDIMTKRFVKELQSKVTASMGRRRPGCPLISKACSALSWERSSESRCESRGEASPEPALPRWIRLSSRTGCAPATTRRRFSV